MSYSDMDYDENLDEAMQDECTQEMIRETTSKSFIHVTEPPDYQSDDYIYRQIMGLALRHLEYSLFDLTRNRSELTVLTSVRDLEKLKYKNEIDFNLINMCVHKFITLTYNECFNAFARDYDAGMQNELYTQICNELRFAASKMLFEITGHQFNI